MVDFSDWESAEDAAYDGPDAEQQAAYAKRKAMREYMELSQQIEDELIAEMGQEEYEASQHWINNPLIKPRSKVSLFEQWEARIRKEEIERIAESIKADRMESKEIDDLFDGIVFQTLSRSEFKEALIKFIKEEQK